MIRIVVIAALGLAICGCSTTTPAERMATQQATCIGYGFKANTDAYSACMMQLDLDQQQQDREQRRKIGAALSGFGAAMATPPRRAVTCNTFGSARSTYGNTFGNSTTTCY